MVKLALKVLLFFVSGKVEGNLSATARLEINQTANVNGDIKTAVLKVDPGASFSGGCQVGSGVKIEEPKPSSSSELLLDHYSKEGIMTELP